MHDPVELPAIVGDGQVTEVSALPALTPAQRAFAARLALGDSMSGAARYAGIARSTAYEWQDLPQVEQEIARYGTIVAGHARRMIVGQVREAVRTLRRLMKPGGSAHKGAPNELAAAKLILDYVRIGELPVGTTQARIISRVPRADDGTFLPHTDDDPALAYREDTLPLAPTADGLPPDFRRGTHEQGTQYAQPNPTLPDHLSDPSFYRRSMYDRET